MKLLHGGGFTKEDSYTFREAVMTNIISSMQSILQSMPRMGIILDDSANEEHAAIILRVPSHYGSPTLAGNHYIALKALWQDLGVQKCVANSNRFQLLDSATYYFNGLDRISSPDYEPTDQDILRTRVKTTGITETVFHMDGPIFRMIDVGGQRSERKKWIHCFEGITAILYLIAISEYDQNLIEDETVNRMYEALNLFESVCNSKWFRKTSVILFLNKTDVFKSKIQRSPISNYFPDYRGGEDFDKGLSYFRDRFENLNKHSHKNIYSHFTCATDTSNMRFVMAAVRDILMQGNLRQVGLL
jgi:guanine nucleotide-binding protein subunit alpha